MEVYPCHVFEARVLTCRVPQLRNKIVHLVNICLQNKLGCSSHCAHSVCIRVRLYVMYGSPQLILIFKLFALPAVACVTMWFRMNACMSQWGCTRRFARSSSSEELFTPTINGLLTNIERLSWYKIEWVWKHYNAIYIGCKTMGSSSVAISG